METIYTIWATAHSAGESANAQLSITVLLDTDGDKVPDITDVDDDNDGWSDSDEGIMLGMILRTITMYLQICR